MPDYGTKQPMADRHGVDADRSTAMTTGVGGATAGKALAAA